MPCEAFAGNHFSKIKAAVMTGVCQACSAVACPAPAGGAASCARDRAAAPGARTAEVRDSPATLAGHTPQLRAQTD